MALASLLPLYFCNAEEPDFVQQLNALELMLADDACLLPPVALGDTLPEADTVILPQMLGDAYRRLADLKAIQAPILVVTSEFGTVSMWDWEINRYLATHGIDVFAPTSLEQTKVICRTLALRKELAGSKFLVFLDNPGEGFQASIFKRFYWWEDECTARIAERFGVTIERRSLRELGAAAKRIPDGQAEDLELVWRSRLVTQGVGQPALRSALKLYQAVTQAIAGDAAICGVGMNCLNESHYCDTTPCLAWNMLYEERRLAWGCEGDTVSMLTKHLVLKSLGIPAMMTNLYPFLMGQAATKHERIPNFPPVPDHPEDHILVAHCGYLGVVPRPFASEWTLRPKVLAIVDENATAIDARLPEGDVTLVKLEPDMQHLTVAEGTITGYAQFEQSDCLNGAVIRVRDGRKLVAELPSHHAILTTGHNAEKLRLMARLLDLELNVA